MARPKSNRRDKRRDKRPTGQSGHAQSLKATSKPKEPKVPPKPEKTEWEVPGYLDDLRTVDHVRVPNWDVLYVFALGALGVVFGPTAPILMVLLTNIQSHLLGNGVLSEMGNVGRFSEAFVAFQHCPQCKQDTLGLIRDSRPCADVVCVNPDCAFTAEVKGRTTAQPAWKVTYNNIVLWALIGRLLRLGFSADLVRGLFRTTHYVFVTLSDKTGEVVDYTMISVEAVIRHFYESETAWEVLMTCTPGSPFFVSFYGDKMHFSQEVDVEMELLVVHRDWIRNTRVITMETVVIGKKMEVVFSVDTCIRRGAFDGAILECDYKCEFP